MSVAAMHRVLRLAAVGSLISLALLTWSFFDVSPLAMVVALTVGQALGTASLVAFIVIVIVDLRRKRVLPLQGDEREDAGVPHPSLPPEWTDRDGKEQPR